MEHWYKQPEEVFDIKTLYLKILQYSHENTSAGVSFNKVTGFPGCNLEQRWMYCTFVSST